ncbi:MAG: hypothetical protein K6F86_08570 [Lachnospiraceae bacterium]|nr:hypothetical protein [Lachnospiraceae bacterium]
MQVVICDDDENICGILSEKVRDFFRVHRSFPVHLKYVAMYNRKIISYSSQPNCALSCAVTARRIMAGRGFAPLPKAI